MTQTFWNRNTSKFCTRRQAGKWLKERGHAVRIEPSDAALEGHRIYLVTVAEKPVITTTQIVTLADAPTFPVVHAAGEPVDPDHPEHGTYEGDVLDLTKPARGWIVRDMTETELADELNSAREGAKLELYTLLDNFMNAILSKYPKAEQLAFGSKREAADEYLLWYADNNYDIAQRHLDMINNEAATIGVPANVLAQQVQVKAAQFEAIVAACSGIRQKAEAQIDAATLEQLPAIVQGVQTQLGGLAS